MKTTMARAIHLASTIAGCKQIEFTIDVKMQFFDQKKYRKIIVLFIESHRYYINKGDLWDLVTLNKLDLVLDQLMKGMMPSLGISPDWDIQVTAIPVKCFEIRTRANGTKIVYE